MRIWKQHLGLKARNTRKESRIQGRVEASRDLGRDGSLRVLVTHCLVLGWEGGATAGQRQDPEWIDSSESVRRLGVHCSDTICYLQH